MRWMRRMPGPSTSMLQMYGTLFLMSGAYTLSKNGMVRGDVLYGFLPQRVQAIFDLTLYIIFFLPGVTALIWAGYRYAGESWASWRNRASPPRALRSSTSRPSSPSPVFHTLTGHRGNLTLHPLLKDGKWPSRVEDVEEVDVEKLKKLVHVKDEDIAKLDEFVTAGKGGNR